MISREKDRIVTKNALETQLKVLREAGSGGRLWTKTVQTPGGTKWFCYDMLRNKYDSADVFVRIFSEI